jgi:hypothetical protein
MSDTPTTADTSADRTPNVAPLDGRNIAYSEALKFSPGVIVMQPAKMFASLLAVVALAVVAIVASSGTASAQLYSETFDPVAGGPITGYGWTQDSVNPGMLNDRIGTFDAGGAAGNVVFSFGNQDELNAFYTDTALSGGDFTAIDPTAFTNGVTLSVDAQPAFNSDATSPVSYFMVQIGGTNWFSSATNLGVGGMNGDPFGNFQLDFDPAAANWNSITVTNGTGIPTPGGPAGANLTGDITGIGIFTQYPLQGTHHFNNFEIFESFAAGDVDGNNDVDINDFNTIRMNFNTVVANRSDGDLNRDGFVDMLDFGEWKDNANVGTGTDFYALLTGVPEPTSITLLAMSLLVGVGRARLRSRAPARAA